MINITVYHNSTKGAIKAAEDVLDFVKKQIDARIVGRQPYDSLLPLWPNLREYGTQLCYVGVIAAPARFDPEELGRAFRIYGFESKIALVIQHHDDPVSKATAEFIHWRLSRLISPLDMMRSVGVISNLVPPCIPTIDELVVNYYRTDVRDSTDPALDIKTPTRSVIGRFAPIVQLDHGDYLALYGLGQPIDRAYLQHPMDVNKSVWVAVVKKDDGWLLCASQFNQTSYQNQSHGLYLTKAQVDRFFAAYDLNTLYIASGDTPIDLFYEMLYLQLSEA